MHTINFSVASNYSHAHGNALHAHALQCLVLYNLTPLCITVNTAAGCTSGFKAFLIVLPLISKHVKLNTFSVAAQKEWHELSWWHQVLEVYGSTKKCLKFGFHWGSMQYFKALGLFNAVGKGQDTSEIGWWHNMWRSVHYPICQV